MYWKELVRVALIGTDRAKLSPDLLKALHDLRVDTSKEASEVVLEGAALLSLIHKTRDQSTDWEGQMPAPAPVDSSSPCSARSARHLSLILNGVYEPALPEFLNGLTANKKCLSYEMLPELLDLCLTHPNLWEKLQRSIGERGAWLIRQNPDWQSFSTDPQQTDWHTGTSDTRVEFLKHLRKTEPEKAIPLIESTWEEDSLKDRLRFIETLEINLSENDEHFLENWLDDKRKEIRRAAATLLGLMPDSALVQRIFERLKGLMSLKKDIMKKPSLDISLPEDDAGELTRDGIDPSIQWYKGGLKASRLGQMVAAIPPHFWEMYFDKNTGETFDLLIRSEWSDLFLQALSDAALRHKDENWMAAIIRFWMENHEHKKWGDFVPKKIIETLPAKVFNQLAMESLASGNPLSDENAPATVLLNSGNHQWEDKLTLAVLNKMQDCIAGKSAGYWSGWHLRTILKHGAYACNPELLETLEKFWETNAYLWASLEQDYNEFLTVLKFRKEMIHELKNNQSEN